MTIINEETSNKYFYLQEQQKQAKKHIKQLQNEKNEIIKTNSGGLKECRLFYQNIHSKQQNCEETQNEILNKLSNSIEKEQNEQLTKLTNKNELKQAISQMKTINHYKLMVFPKNFIKCFMTS